jgi:malate synthase
VTQREAVEVDIRVTGAEVERGGEILTQPALAFVAELQREFGARRDELLAARRTRRAQVSRTGRLDFLPETADVRNGEWSVAAAPEDLVDRRVEMTGPTDRKMTINALNSGARVWLADMEDASTPHWSNVVGGQVNLYDAIRRNISFVSPEGKTYDLKTDQRLATIVMRPRGWHFDEQHILVDGKPVAGAFVDFGLYFFHNAKELLERGSGPYFYLPKMESHLEARLWNDVFTFSQEKLGVPYGSVRATVLIETIPAAFEMEEILYELRDHISGLNAGRWDYLFSMIKYFRDSGPSFVLPDRNVVGMKSPFMRAYAQLLVKTCHKRGAFAIGGMSAFIPSRRDQEVNARAFAKVREDKEREAGDGFDGSWVAHPDLVPVCQEVFDRVLGDKANQLDRRRDDVNVTAEDLLDVAATPGDITREGLHGNVEVALLYLESWLRGNGAVAIHNLMEDAATAEIARSQIWQWVHNESKLDDGTAITRQLVKDVLDTEMDKIREQVGDGYSEREFDQARELFERVALADDFADFLTLPAYDAVIKR